MIRAATVDDVPALVVLEQALLPDPWSAAQVLSELTGPGRRGWVAGDEAVAGYAITMTLGDVTDLQRIAVAPDHQRQGLARALLDAALADAAAAGSDRVLLEVSDRNRAAVSLYAAAGFTEIDRRPRYYTDGSDAIVMRRSLARGCSWEAS